MLGGVKIRVRERIADELGAVARAGQELADERRPGADLGPGPPQFFKRRLHHVTGIFLVTKVFYNKPEHTIGMQAYTVIIVLLGHKQLETFSLPLYAWGFEKV